ncbi:MAG: RES domain-containing protein [Bdellovibrionales bacterium]|nr:RES domain-containing protein [Bdellovibrionales bacterium]
MGLAKGEWERRQEEKWAPIEDSQVCTRCFVDDELKKFIIEGSDGVGCDYCEDVGAKKRKSRNINDVIERISEAIRGHYEDPAEHMAYETAEGGYLGSTTDTYDLLEELVEVENPCVLDAVRGAFEHTLWCKKNPYSDDPSDVMFQDWTSYCEFIKHKKRFFLSDTKGMFDGIVRDFKKLKLFKIIKPGNQFFRARTFQSTNPFPLKFEEITSPPKKVLIKQANRMSAAGISLFYCSATSETCKSEARTSNVYGIQHDMVAYASFSTKKTLRLLDISKLPHVPSIFGSTDRIERENLIFLRMFRDDIMKPVKRDGREHVEYIPSQIFTEYIRFYVKNGLHSINGICYPSTQNSNGLNYALFLSSDQIEEKRDLSSTAYIFFNSDIKFEKLS